MDAHIKKNKNILKKFANLHLNIHVQNIYF